MAAPVLLRVSVPRWERVARYAVCAAGILLSIYAYHVEREKERDPEHRALCDLGPWVKCSAALASRYPGWGSGPGTAERGEGGGWGRGARGGSWAWDRWVPGRGGTRGAASGTRTRPAAPAPGLPKTRRGGGGGAARPARRYEVAVQPGGQSAPGVGPAREEREVRAAWVLAGGTPFLVVARGGRSGCETLREGECVR